MFKGCQVHLKGKFTRYGLVTDNNKIFNIDNPSESQAFGVSLEPAGGSKSPTLEELYTLGVVDSTS